MTAAQTSRSEDIVGKVQLIKINAGTHVEREEVVRVIATNSEQGTSLISYVKGANVATRWISSHRVYNRD